PITIGFDPESPDSKLSSWVLSGKTLNISGSGLLAIFPKDPPSKQKLTIVTKLIPNRPPLLCVGHIIRSKRLRRESYQVSFQFDDISPKMKDDIISFCLKKQRDQLRDKIQVAG
ncbi:MAG: PilZ domain-containing protein, partial [Desulfocapsa sp.]|nr:PilZ domain-containing protein [Desulfocapsa sp.]